jgi:DNA-directed RNA polymerase
MQFLLKYGDNVVPATRVSAWKKSKTEMKAEASAQEAREKLRLEKEEEETTEEEGDEGMHVDTGLELRDMPLMAKGKRRQADLEADFNISEPVRPAQPGYVRIADIIPPVPLRGKFDIERVRDSTYFFR